MRGGMGDHRPYFLAKNRKNTDNTRRNGSLELLGAKINMKESETVPNQKFGTGTWTFGWKKQSRQLPNITQQVVNRRQVI